MPIKKFKLRKTSYVVDRETRHAHQALCLIDIKNKLNEIIEYLNKQTAKS